MTQAVSVTQIVSKIPITVTYMVCQNFNDVNHPKNVYFEGFNMGFGGNEKILMLACSAGYF